LVLADAWRRAAGPALAARARAVRAERGTLEIEVPDRRWAEALAGQLVELASLTSALAPDLLIRKLRVRLSDGTEVIAASPVAPEGESRRAPVRAEPARPRPRGGTSESGAVPAEATPEKLGDLRDRYLARFAGDRRGPGARRR
jgi:hypothetical protein